MGIFNSWRNKPTSLEEAKPAREGTPTPPAVNEKLRKEFAQLCTLNVLSQDATVAYEKGYADFLTLISDPRLQVLGVDTENHLLLLGTNLVRFRRKKTKQWHIIGELLITVFVVEKIFNFENITSPLRWSNSVYHHPHVMEDGVICMTQGMQQIQLALSEGNLLDASRMLLAAAFTLDSVPFAGLEYWPLDSNQE